MFALCDLVCCADFLEANEGFVPGQQQQHALAPYVICCWWCKGNLGLASFLPSSNNTLESLLLVEWAAI